MEECKVLVSENTGTRFIKCPYDVTTLKDLYSMLGALMEEFPENTPIGYFNHNEHSDWCDTGSLSIEEIKSGDQTILEIS